MTKEQHFLKAKRIGIETKQEHIIFLLKDSGICKSEGFSALSRVVVKKENQSIIATINSLNDKLLEANEAGLSESVWKQLDLSEGDRIEILHPNPLDSLGFVRAKLFGHPLEKSEFEAIISDIYKGRYSNIHLSAFISGCVGDRLSTQEVIYLTESMVGVGQKLSWDSEIVVDKHCVGGLPGNRVTPIVVSIVAAAGLMIPKTSSRAITSPSGTADTMETMTTINLSLQQMKKVVLETNGCMVWGGSVNLSPADDMIIRVEKALDVDSEGQMIASVISKKVAAGSTHLVLDIPVGHTAKVRTSEAAESLKKKLTAVCQEVGLKVKVLITDGSQPIGRGVGPSLEARDVLSVLRNEQDAPDDLKEKALLIAGSIFELAEHCGKGKGYALAKEILQNGSAKKKFFEICEAQGGFKEPPVAPYIHHIHARCSGIVSSIDNRRLARVAKLAGAPHDPAAGIEIFVKNGMKISSGDTLYSIHAQAEGELNYALAYVKGRMDMIEIEE